MRTAHSSSRPGGLHTPPPGPGTPIRPDTPETRQPPPWTEFLTHATENITLLQTSFASGNKQWDCQKIATSPNSTSTEKL